MNNYFVTVSGITTSINISKDKAIDIAKKEFVKNPEKGTLNIGIGRTKFKNGKCFYTLLPMHFICDN